MASPFKMKPKTPMMKALVGKQANLPQHLKDKILAAPETAKKGSPAKSYGSKSKSPVMKKELSTEKNREISDYRRGKGRADVTKKGSIIEGSEQRKLGTGMGPAGTKKAGSAGKRYAGKGQPGSPRQLVVREKTASEIKKRGVDLKTKEAKGKSPIKKEISSLKASQRSLKKAGKARQLRKEANDPKSGLSAESRAKNRKKAEKLSTKSKRIHNKGVVRKGASEMHKEYKRSKVAKGKSPAKSYGSKKKSPMMKKGVKGLEMQRGKK